MPAMILYNCNDNRKTINKTLGTPTVIQTITPYEPVSDLEGYVIVNYNADYMDMNYAAYLNSKYFIEDRELLTGGKMKLHLRMDVLETFKTDILACPAISERSNSGNPYISDPMIPTQSYKLYKTYYFKNAGNVISQFSYTSGAGGSSTWDPQYVLITVG